MGFDYLWSPSGQPVLLLCHPHSKYVFPHICIELPEFQFLPLPLVLLLGTAEKSLASGAGCLCIYLFCTIDGEIIKQCMENVTDIICPDFKKPTNKKNLNFSKISLSHQIVRR